MPVPFVELRCDKKCCLVAMLPLRTCKAITVHESQGMTTGARHLWKKVVLELPATGERRTPGSELVGASRAEKLEDLAIANPPSTLNRNDLKKIRTGTAFRVWN